MNREETIKYLKMLAEKLADKGINGDIYLIGGAAIMIAYDAKRATKDIDAVFAPKRAIREAAEKVALQCDLKEDWLNDAAKGYLSGKKDTQAVKVLDEPGLRIMAASAELLLAMKLLSSRREDEGDIIFLCKHLNIKSANEALNILTKYYPDKIILPKSKLLIEELFGDRRNIPEY